MVLLLSTWGSQEAKGLYPLSLTPASPYIDTQFRPALLFVDTFLKLQIDTESRISELGLWKISSLQRKSEARAT
jgi:hypothetical protein